MLAIVIILGVVSLLGTMAVRLGPVYIDNMTIKSVLQSIAADPEAGQKSVPMLRKELSSRFITNRIETINVKDIKFKTEKTVVTMDASYETRVPLFYNIDAVVVFDNLVFEIPRR